MSKNKKKPSNVTSSTKKEDKSNLIVNEVESSKVDKVVEVKAKDTSKDKKAKKKEKVKKPNKIAQSFKNTGNELKKVTWPKFGTVAKQTGIVLAFVLIFAVVLFGFDKLVTWLTGFLF